MKVALITGANKGLGLETARQLGKKGITVLLGSRSQANGDVAAAQLVAEGIDAHALSLDVTKAEDIAAVVSYIKDHYQQLDILVNNAGVIQGETLGDNSALTIAPDMLRSTFDTNFFGAVALTQALVPLLKKSEGGRIVNVSSILSSLTLHADPASAVGHSKPLAYNASKAALNMFTILLADALKDTPIKVNSAHPGWVKTDLGGPNAPMKPESGVRTIIQLATLPADGPSGRLIHVSREIPW
jgi:NAD(P)-dependent dehydrogenase (short-subunit alcohol dehydrogenase family)